MIQEVHVNRRGKDRVNTTLNAQYFIKQQSARYTPCQITNLSRTGAAVVFPVGETLTPGTPVLMDIYVPGTLLHVSAQAEIRRVEKRNDQLIAGIKFTEMLSETMFQQLIK